MKASAEPVADTAPEFPSEWYEPFPEPRTLPVGWDLNGIVQAAALAQAETEPATEILSA